jgi:acetoin utilization deacetylase AcuC-like enzyme
MKEIPVYHSPETAKHDPQYEIHEGRQYPNFDSLRRYEVIMDALKISRFADIRVSTVNALPQILSVHDQSYVEHLANISNNLGLYATDAELSSFPNMRRAIYPSVFPYSPVINKTRITGDGSIGLFAYDTYTPILSTTYDAAVASAGVAVAGANELLFTGDQVVYGLTRPPGHHAGRSGMMGYCYFNNAAIAAETFIRNRRTNVTILDLDLHHGNGDQDYGYNRGDIQYISIHGDPSYCYPFLTGFADEKGTGEGEGTNINYPLPNGADEELYQKTFDDALQKIYRYCPDYLVVAAGFDTHAKDPFQTFKLSTEYYQKLGNKILGLGLKTLILQEGGYNTEILGANVVSFLKGFTGA